MTDIHCTYKDEWTVRDMVFHQNNETKEHLGAKRIGSVSGGRDALTFKTNSQNTTA